MGCNCEGTVAFLGIVGWFSVWISMDDVMRMPCTSNGGQRFASISFVSDPAAAACMPHGTVCMCVLLENERLIQ